MLQKTTDPNFYRDEDTGALINTNVTAYRLYKEKRSGDKTVAELHNTVNNLQSELSEVKDLLRKLLENKNV